MASKLVARTSLQNLMGPTAAPVLIVLAELFCLQASVNAVNITLGLLGDGIKLHIKNPLTAQIGLGADLGLAIPASLDGLIQLSLGSLPDLALNIPEVGFNPTINPVADLQLEALKIDALLNLIPQLKLDMKCILDLIKSLEVSVNACGLFRTEATDEDYLLYQYSGPLSGLGAIAEQVASGDTGGYDPSTFVKAYLTVADTAARQATLDGVYNQKINPLWPPFQNLTASI